MSAASLSWISDRRFPDLVAAAEEFDEPSVAGIVFTLLSVFAFIACGFMGKTVKEEALQAKKA